MRLVVADTSPLNYLVLMHNPGLAPGFSRCASIAVSDHASDGLLYPLKRRAKVSAIIRPAAFK